MNNISTSECSNGCESGWTMYLDQSLNYGDGKCYKEGYEDGKWSYHEKEEEDDLSMVSDASSGPSRQKIDEDEENKYGFYCGSNSQEKRKTRLKKDVDDTASSRISTKMKSGLLKKASSGVEEYASKKSVSWTNKKKGCDLGAQENWDRRRDSNKA